MKKPVLSIEEPDKKAPRRPPSDHWLRHRSRWAFQSEFATAEAAEIAGRKMKSAYPMLQIEIYAAETKVRTLITGAF